MKQRTSCQYCGSSDNNVWMDDHWFCYSPQCYDRQKKSGSGSRLMGKSMSKPVKNFKPIKGTPVSIHKRSLTGHTCSKYGVVAHKGDLYFPYYDKGKVQGYKVKNPGRPKKHSFYIQGNITKLLFGNQAVHNKKVIAITSGEFDAMSVLQMTNVTGVSLSADGMAEMATQYNLEWLESFEKIILCIDNDIAGETAIDTILSILRPYQTYRMVFPSGYKDANDMLMARQAELFTRAFWSARAIPIKTVFTKDELSLQLKTHYQVPEGINTGIIKLDNMLGGLRPGELTTIMGRPSVGKSTFARIILSNLLRAQHQSMLFALEEEPIKYGRRLLHSYAGKPLITLAREKRDFLVDTMSNYLLISKHNGLTAIKDISHGIEYAVRQSGVKIVLLDNVAAGVDKGQLYTQTSEYISVLFSTAKKFNIHIVSVCHVGREDKKNPSNKPGMDSGYGSGAIEQQSDNILLVDKEQDTNKLTIHMLKNRELGLPNNPYVSLTYDVKSGRYLNAEKISQDARKGTSHTRFLSSKKNKSSLKERARESRDITTKTIVS